MRWGKIKGQQASHDSAWFVTGTPLPGTEAAVGAIENGEDGDERDLVERLGIFDVLGRTEHDATKSLDESHWRT